MFKRALIYLFTIAIVGCNICHAQSPAQEQLLKRKEDSLSKILANSQQDSTKMNVLLGLIALYQDVQPKKTVAWSEQGMALAANNHNNEKLLAFQVTAIRCNNRLGLFNDALDIASKAEPLLKKGVQPRTAAAFYMQKGAAYYKIAAYSKAAIEYNNAVAIGRNSHLPEVEVKAIMNLAILYEALERFDDMHAQLLAALAIAEKNKLEEDKANLKFNLAYLESKLNNYGKAIDYLLEVLPYFESKGNKTVMATGYGNLGWGYYQVKEYAKALDYTKKSFLLRTEMSDQAGLAKLHINLGQVYLELSNYDSALINLNKGIELSKKLNIPAQLRDGYKTLSSLYERKKQYKEALESMQSFAQWKDTTNQQDKQKQLIQQLNVYKNQYADSTTIQNSVALQKKQATVQWLGWGLLTCLLGIAALAIWIVALRKKAFRAVSLNSNKEQSLSEAEERHLKELFSEKEKLQHEILALKSEVRQLESGLRNQTREDLESLRKLVGDSKLQSEGYWNEFLLLFSKVYPNFFEQLKTQYPQLSQSELRLCSLMKLNLSLLEISNLLNIAAESVRKARYRMYKKMDLASDQELADKMLTF